MQDLIKNDNKFNLVSSDDFSKNTELANLLRNTFDTMNFNQKKEFLNKIITEKQVNRLLLKYEMKNIQFKKFDNSITLEQFYKFVLDNIKRYHQKCSGFYIEDNEWVVDKSPEKIVLINTLDTDDTNDNDTELFTDFIVDKLGKTSNKFNIECDFITDDEEEDIDLLKIIISYDKEDPEDAITL